MRILREVVNVRGGSIMRRSAPVVVFLLVAVMAMPAVAAGHEKVPVDGTWTALYDFSTLEWTEKGPAKCLLELEADLEFEGDFEGTATGSYDVLIFASCADAQEAPPGFYKDLYQYNGSLTLTLDEVVDAQARIKYLGTEGPPLGVGEFKGMMILTGDVTGILRVESSPSGPTYSGFIHTRSG